MAIAHRSTGALAAAAATSVSVTLPTHSTNDLIIVFGGGREDSAADNLTISGWTAIGTQAFLDLGTSAITLHAWYKFAASGAESNPTITGAGSATGGCFGFAVVYSGVDQTTPLSGVTPLQGTSAAADQYTPPTITPDSASARMVISCVATADDNALAIVTAQGFTTRADGANYDTTTGLDIAFAMTEKEVTQSTAVTLPTYDQTLVGTDAWAYKTFVLRPDPNATVAATTVAAVATVGTPTVTVPSVTLVEEKCDDTDNTTLTTGNSVFDILNGAGTSTYQDTPTPVAGTTCLAFDGTGSTARTAKDSSTLPGTTNGGTVLRKVYFRGYVRASVAPSAISRLAVFEESVANGGADVWSFRMNATGAFALLDGTTSIGASTRTISTTEWTRVEIEADQDANTLTGRLWWGADLNNASTGATNYETWSGALTTNTDMEVWGIGTYATGGASIVYWDEVVVAKNNWVGPLSADPNATVSASTIAATATVGVPTVTTSTSATVTATTIAATADVPGVVPSTFTVRTSGFGADAINAVAYGNGVWVAVGASGLLATATDPTGTWTQQTSSFGSTNINGIAYGNGVWVAVGESGKLATATDPTATWTQQTSSFSTTPILDIAYGNGIWVATGQTGKLATATDPTATWTQETSGFGTNWVYSAAYGNGIWTAVGQASTVATATDPTGTWTVNGTVASGQTFQSVIYEKGVWVAVGTGGVLYTATDPTGTWTSRTSSFAGSSITDVAYGNNVWTIVGATGKLATATDPTGTWTAGTSAITSTTIEAVGYGNGYWTVAGAAGKLTTSPTIEVKTGSTVSAGTIAATATVGTPSVSTQGNATVTATTVAAVASLGTPTVSAGTSATVTAVNVAATATVGAPVITGLLSYDDFNNTNGTTVTSGNSIFDIFNGGGTTTFTNSPTPINGSTALAIDGTSALRTNKDSSSLPGTENGGAAIRELYGRLYCRAAAANTTTRFWVFESSVPTAGTDIAVVRLNGTGAFNLLDGTTLRTATTRTISTTEWTRLELKIDQNNNLMTLRLWWGADLHNPSTGVTNYEEITSTLDTNTDIEVWGVGSYSSCGTTLYVDQVAVGTGNWIGPAAYTAAGSAPMRLYTRPKMHVLR